MPIKSIDFQYYNLARRTNYRSFMKTEFIILFFTVICFAQDSTRCYPPCRSGYICQNGNCISECNPSCDAGYKCFNNDCIPIVQPGVVQQSEEKKTYRLSENPFLSYRGFPGFWLAATIVSGVLVGSLSTQNGTGAELAGVCFVISLPVFIVKTVKHSRYNSWNEEHNIDTDNSHEKK